jgi:pyruvate ferredoxin oxidoreductase gamma subunit
VLINTGRPIAELGLADVAGRFRLITVPATDLAREHLGRPIPSAALLGAFAAVVPLIGLESVAAAIRERFAGRVADGNVAAAGAAYRLVQGTARERSHA